MRPTQIVEAVLFASDAPLQAGEIARADESLDEDVVEAAIEELRAEYDESDRAFHVVELGEGYQLLTRSEFSTYLERFDTVPRSSRLSGPALETLAIVAFRQPISRVEVEYIRGVASAGVLRTLQDRGLVDVVGRSEGLGRPYLYGTTTEFLNHFGFRSLEDLPRPEELPVVLREPRPLDEDEAPEGDDPERDLLSVEEEEPEESTEEAVARVLEGIPEEERSAGEEADEEGRRAAAPKDAAAPGEDPVDPEEGRDVPYEEAGRPD